MGDDFEQAPNGMWLGPVGQRELSPEEQAIDLRAALTRREYEAVVAIIGPPPSAPQFEESITPVQTQITPGGGLSGGDWITTTGGGQVQGDPNADGLASAYASAMDAWLKLFDTTLQSIQGK